MMNSLRRLRGSTQDIASVCKWAGASLLLSAVGLAIWYAVSSRSGYHPTLDLKFYVLWSTFVEMGRYGIQLVLFGEIVLLFQPAVASSTAATTVDTPLEATRRENDSGTAAAKHNVILEDLVKAFINLWRDPVRLGYWSGIFILFSVTSLAVWVVADPREAFGVTSLDHRIYNFWRTLLNGFIWGLPILAMARIVDLVQRSRGSRPST